MDDQTHVIDVLGPTVLPVLPEIDAAARHIWREKPRHVLIEGDIGTGKTYLATVLTLQLFWSVHSGLWREMNLPPGERLYVVCFVEDRIFGSSWVEYTRKMLKTGFLDRAPDPGPHPCEVKLVSRRRDILGVGALMFVMDEGAAGSPSAFSDVVRHSRRGVACGLTQTVRVNPFIHQAQWAGVTPGVFTAADTTVVRLRLPDWKHDQVWGKNR